MTQAYSDPDRARDPYALPDIELWPDLIEEIDCECGVYDVPISFDTDHCPSCKSSNITKLPVGTVDKWWFWYCFPGCLPDSEVFGPYHTEEGALRDARDL